jgi:threonine dehydrogenase-like Zn-dependent dehydrogenase
LEVGVDGTDREINEGQYGATPSGADFLVLGHEGFGVVEEVSSAVTKLKPADYVVPIVRRPGASRYDVVGMPDMTTDDDYLEHGIKLCHGFLTEYHVDCLEYLVRVPNGLRHVGVLLEPTSIAERGIFQAYEVQGRLRIWAPHRAAALGAGTLGLLAALLLRLRGLEVMVYARSEPPT